MSSTLKWKCTHQPFIHIRTVIECVRVNPRNGMGTHVSIFTYFLFGRFDDYLKWPFRGSVTIQLVNQVGDYGHVEYTIAYNDGTPDDSASRVQCGRVTRE